MQFSPSSTLTLCALDKVHESFQLSFMGIPVPRQHMTATNISLFSADGTLVIVLPNPSNQCCRCFRSMQWYRQFKKSLFPSAIPTYQGMLFPHSCPALSMTPQWMGYHKDMSQQSEIREGTERKTSSGRSSVWHCCQRFPTTAWKKILHFPPQRYKKAILIAAHS